MDSETLFPVLAGIARHGLTTLGGVLISQGYLHSSDLNSFIGAGMVIAGVAWSWWQKKGQAEVVELLKKAKQQ